MHSDVAFSAGPRLVNIWLSTWCEGKDHSIVGEGMDRTGSEMVIWGLSISHNASLGHGFWSNLWLEVLNSLGNFLLDYAHPVYVCAPGFCLGLLGMKVRSTWLVMAQKQQSFLSGNGCQWKKSSVMYVNSLLPLHDCLLCLCLQFWAFFVTTAWLFAMSVEC